MKKVLSLVLALCLCASLMVPAFAAPTGAQEAAEILYSYGLFKGVGQNADGTPDFDLDRAPTRAEAVTLLVRLLGKEAEARNGNYATPFTDVPQWAAPYVGYAYAHGLTTGTSSTTFSSGDTVSATQYLTFVLRALGYTTDDFAWDSAWTLTDELGITQGQYNAGSAFTRGDAALVSLYALDKNLKDGSMTLAEAINKALEEAPFEAGLYVQGVLECLYYGKTDLSGFYDIVNFDAAFAKELFQGNVEKEIEFFYSYFDVLPEYLNAETEAKYEQLVKDIYAQAKFAVTSVNRGANERYTVTLDLTPIALFKEYLDKYAMANIEAYNLAYDAGYNPNMSDAAYEAFQFELEVIWANNLIRDMRAIMAAGMPYSETRSVVIEVYLTDDGEYYIMNQEHLNQFDWYVINYDVN